MPFVADKLTFFGVPRYGGAVADQSHAVMFGVASSLGSTFADSRNGPHFLRRLSQHYVWQSDRPTLLDLREPALDFSGVCDAGDVVGDDLEGVSRELIAFVSELRRHCVPIAVGGDHSITLPLVSGLRRASTAPFKLVSFDHHLDYQFWSRERDALFHTNVLTHVLKLERAPVTAIGPLIGDDCFEPCFRLDAETRMPDPSSVFAFYQTSDTGAAL